MAIHQVDFDLLTLNGLPHTEAGAKKMVEADPKEKVIPGTFRVIEIQGQYSKPYKFAVVECNCPEIP